MLQWKGGGGGGRKKGIRISFSLRTIVTIMKDEMALQCQADHWLSEVICLA